MGADLIYSTAPACNLTEDRLARLNQIIEGLPDDDLPDYVDDIDDWKDRLRNALEALDTGRRDVSLLDVRRIEFPLLITGGLSWGDSPTDAETCFSDIGECNPLWAQLEEWAKADAEPRFPASVWALVEAANALLTGLIDAGDYGPGIEGDDDALPHDEDGSPWYTDVWELQEALKPFQPKVKEQ